MTDCLHDKKSNGKSLAEQLKDFGTAASAVSAAIGIAFSAYTYVSTQWAKNDEAQRAQLSTFSTYGQYLKRYQGVIQPALGQIMSDPLTKSLDKAMRDKDTTACKKVIDTSTTKTGFEVFVSPPLKNAREVHNFYESVSYGLAEGQLDFEVIFELITLPAYWNIQNPESEWYNKKGINEHGELMHTYLFPDFSVLLPWRTCLGTGFYGDNKPLSDFSDGVDRLGFNYLFARAKYLYNRSCKRGKPNKEGDIFVMNGRSSPWPLATLESACETLRKRLREMALANGRPKSWMQLYNGNKYDIDPDIDILGRPYRFPWSK